MRRRFEFLLYAIAILYFIGRYADGDVSPRRGPSIAPQPDASILLPDNARLPRDISSSVVVDIDAKSQASVGTAFAVDHDGTYVSARHVIEGCKSIALIQSQRAVPVQLLAKANNRDFAILRSTNVKAKPFELSLDTPRRGDDGFMMGFPQGSPADVRATVIGDTVMRSRGRYSARERVVAWVERERRPGFSGSLGGISGGPVFDADGRIIGTVVAGAPRRGRVYTTAPKVFAEAGLAPQADITRSDEGITTENFDEKADGYRSSLRIAQVYCSVD